MKTKLGKYIAILSMLGLLASCAQTGALEAENAYIRKAAESARTPADHYSLAQQYQNTSRELQVKAEEQRKLLQHYEEKSYLYGRQAQDNKSHTSALLSKYERAVEDTVKQAAYHQNMAAELTKGNYAVPAEGPARQESKAKMGTDPSHL
ncbi:MAG: hypothetical protein H0X43_01745 [Nitrosospira sp.]|nr:hypothetical protein [Nitrosospira sp.]